MKVTVSDSVFRPVTSPVSLLAEHTAIAIETVALLEVNPGPGAISKWPLGLPLCSSSVSHLPSAYLPFFLATQVGLGPGTHSK